MKIGKNTSDTCALPSEAYGGETVNYQVFSSGKNGSKRIARTWKMMKELVVQDFIEPKKIMKKCGICCIQSQ
jgi:hypothetical protein